MTDSKKTICRYFNTINGCWYGDCCRFLHIPNKKPLCKFYNLSLNGCRYGENCHFSHDRTPFKLVENNNIKSTKELVNDIHKDNVDVNELTRLHNTEIKSMMNSINDQTVQNVSQSGDNNHVNNPNEFILNVSIAADGDDNSCDSTDIMNVSTVKHSIVTNEINQIKSKSNTDLHCILSVESIDTHDNLTEYKTQSNVSVKEDTSTINKQSSDILNENEIFCGSCKRILEYHKNGSYCTLLKNHYLECFLDKEGDHIKCVKIRSGLEYGQMFWCKLCLLIFEKPWSLFQHMADKTKSNKIQQWEKKTHLDWLDNVASLMAGYDLGLFTAIKLGADLRNLLTSQNTVEEDMKAAAFTTAVMMQWFRPFTNSWCLQQCEMIRKIEQISRQVFRKANFTLNSGFKSRKIRAALPPTPTSSSVLPCQTYVTNQNTTNSLSSISTSTLTANSFDVYQESSFLKEIYDQDCFSEAASSVSIEQDKNTVSGETTYETQTDACTRPINCQLSPVGDKVCYHSKPCFEEKAETSILTTGASGDTSLKPSVMSTKIIPTVKSRINKNIKIIDSNNTNSAHSLFILNERNASGYNKALSNSVPTLSNKSIFFHNKISPNSTTMNSQYLKKPYQCQVYRRNSRSHSFDYNTRRIYHRIDKITNHKINDFNAECLCDSLDLNFGFTNDEIDELLLQGIKPWDSEASATLAILKGELDHLLDW
ncbi:zinc finger CCCH domain containing 31 [Schistosoma japonicum]|uniref:Zinc finger CCCH domain containing 31 n=1 Tax=Schistosoma japonicum TaxID=6182 RepID=A0A4Z2CW74_SCHJA|nr:zinc finger CCCH domain containing 31 [Schistosoma japonicum]